MAHADDPAPRPPADDLQFDVAEYAEPAGASSWTDAGPAQVAAGPTCTYCHEPVGETYYTINQAIACRRCHDGLALRLRGGSRGGRFLRAGLFGSLAAVAGFALYFGVLKLTGYEIGLISVLVGFMVGTAVRKGSDARGGWAYQLLAVFLTYSAIVASYGALLVPEMIAQGKARAAGKVAAPADPAGAETTADPTPDDDDATTPKAAGTDTPKAAGDDAVAATKAAPDAEAGDEPLSPGLLLMMSVVLLGFLYVLPIWAGFSQPIGLFIIGFALWQAWKMNTRVTIPMSGPHLVRADGGNGPGTAADPNPNPSPVADAGAGEVV